MARDLPIINFPLGSGVNTKFDPAGQSAKTLLIGQNCDGFDVFQSISKVPGATVVSLDHGSPVVSLHQFEFINLLGVRERQQVSLAGGILREIVDATTFQQLATGLVSEPLNQVEMNEKLFLSSRNQRALPTGGLQYNGELARNWGVLAPGQTHTVQEDFDTPGDFTAGADTTLSTNTANQDGDNSLQLDKTGTASVNITADRTTTIDLLTGVDDIVFIYVFVPAGALQLLKTTGDCFTVGFFDTGAKTNGDQHGFEVGELLQGWNLLSINLADPERTILGGGLSDRSSVGHQAYGFFTQLTATTVSGFLLDNFYSTDDGSPTVTPSATDGGLTVDRIYTYRITYLTEDGEESNAGPPSPGYTPLAAAASGLLTITGQPSNTETVTIDGKAYTFQTVLTDVDGNVLIGASAALTRDNLRGAINLDGVPGTDYALSTTLHPTVTAAALAANLEATAKTKGAAGNSIATVEAASNYVWGAATLENGIDSISPTVGALPVSTDPAATGRRVYRDVDNDFIYRFVAEITNNVDLTFVDTVADASLGIEQPPLAGDALVDASPPGRFADTAVFAGRIFGIIADQPFIVQISDPGFPGSFRLTEQLTFEEDLVALESHAYGLLLYATDKIFLLSGDGVGSPFRVDEVTAQQGANGFRSVIKFKSVNFAIRESELFVVVNPADPWFINGPVLDQFQALTNSELEDLHMVHDRSRFRIVIFGKVSGTYSVVMVYQYGTSGFQQVTGDGSGTDPQDGRTGVWWTLALPSAYNPQCSALVETTADLPELWVGGNDGYVYYLQEPTAANYSVGGGAPAAVDMQVETHTYPLGKGQGGRGEPRYITLPTSTSTGITWTVDFTLLTDAQGSVIRTAQKTVVVPAGDSSPQLPIPSMGRGEWLKIKVSNAVLGETGTLRGIQVGYIPRVDYRGFRSG